MILVDIIRNAMSATLSSEDGDQIELELMPGLSPEEIKTFADSLPCPLPDEMQDLLTFCRGFSGSAVEFIDFTGQGCFFEAKDIFPHGVPIAADGFGNFWVVDLTSESPHFGPVYFACHDAPVILCQSRTLADFLLEVFRMTTPPYESLINEVHDDKIFNVWRKNPGVTKSSDVTESEDPLIRSFSDTLDKDWFIVDLRNASPGMGLSWGRYGSDTEIRRFGSHPLFAYRKPKGIWSRALRK